MKITKNVIPKVNGKNAATETKRWALVSLPGQGRHMTMMPRLAQCNAAIPGRQLHMRRQPGVPAPCPPATTRENGGVQPPPPNLPWGWSHGKVPKTAQFLKKKNTTPDQAGGLTHPLTCNP